MLGACTIENRSCQMSCHRKHERAGAQALSDALLLSVQAERPMDGVARGLHKRGPSSNCARVGTICRAADCFLVFWRPA